MSLVSHYNIVCLRQMLSTLEHTRQLLYKLDIAKEDFQVLNTLRIALETEIQSQIEKLA